MRKLLLFTLFLFGIHLMYSNDLNTIKTEVNDNLFSFDLKTNATSESLTIVTNTNQSIMIKVIDKSGLIRIQKKLHLERAIDVSALKVGHYLIKVYSGNHMAVRRFYKGRDAINVR